VADVQAGLEGVASLAGGDLPGSHAAALWTIAAGDPSRVLPEPDLSGCRPGTSGLRPCRGRWPGVPVVVLITDRPFHDGPGGSAAYGGTVGGVVPPTFDEAVAELTAHGYRTVGIDTGAGAASADLEALARATGTVDLGDLPLVRPGSADGDGLGAVIVDALQTLAVDVPVDVRVLIEDDPADGVDVVSAFVDHVAVDVTGRVVVHPVTGESRVCTAGFATADDDGDGWADILLSVPPGVAGCAVVVPKRNSTVPATREPQLFRAVLRMTIDGRSPVDERDVYFLVPPEW
jgi:hypothetical protein